LLGPIEFRAANLVNAEAISLVERILTVVAVPYEEEAQVTIDDQLWTEVFSRGAFDGIEARVEATANTPLEPGPGEPPPRRRIPVNRDHDMKELVGLVVAAFPDREEGLVLDLRVSETLKGDETLALAKDNVLSPSIGFAVRPADQDINRTAMTRRVNRAFLDHLALVPQPAYMGAHVMAMRDGSSSMVLGPVRPGLDELMADPVFRWAQQRAAQQRDDQERADTK